MANKINQIFAYVAIDEDGDEGITGFRTPEGWMPMVGADEDRMMSLKPMAERIADDIPIRLVRFTTREDIEIITNKHNDVVDYRDSAGRLICGVCDDEVAYCGRKHT